MRPERRKHRKYDDGHLYEPSNPSLETMTINNSFAQTIRSIFTDGGALLFCIVVPLVYPVLYSLIYNRENVREVPVTVVDECRSPISRDYIRRLDATADVRVTGHAPDMLTAQEGIKKRDVYGIVRIPSDFQDALMQGRQTHVQCYCDMSGMLYYKAILTANTDVSLAMNAEVKVADLGGNPVAMASGINGGTAEQRGVLQHPVRYEAVSLFNAQSGFASFLIPAVLVLVIQQTMLLGIGLLAGTRRERGVRTSTELGALSTLTGVALAFIAVYIPVSAYVLCVVPAMFDLPQIGSLWHLAMLMLPFLVAVFNLGITVATLPRHRETIFLLVVFTSVPLLFLTGVSWPGAAMPDFWRYFAMIFPSTHGANAYIRIYAMGATLADVRHEYLMLWALAAFYAVTAWLSVRFVFMKKRTENAGHAVETAEI